MIKVEAHNLKICFYERYQSMPDIVQEVEGVESSWKIERIVSMINKKDAGRFYKVKYVKYIWQPETVLLPLQVFTDYWQQLDFDDHCNAAIHKVLDEEIHNNKNSNENSIYDTEEALNIEITTTAASDNRNDSVEDSLCPPNFSTITSQTATADVCGSALDNTKPSTNRLCDADNTIHLTQPVAIETRQNHAIAHSTFHMINDFTNVAPSFTNNSFTANTSDDNDFTNNEHEFQPVNQSFTNKENAFTNSDDNDKFTNNEFHSERNENNFENEEDDYTNADDDFNNGSDYSDDETDFEKAHIENSKLTEKSTNQNRIHHLTIDSCFGSSNLSNSYESSETLSNITTTEQVGSSTTEKELLKDTAKDFVCEVCSKVFQRRTTLRRHMFIHTGEKPWHCSTCNKSFNQKSILNRHLLIHSNTKLFSCDVCELSFTEKGALTRHKAVHNPNEKKWVCDICDKAFILKGYLTKHKFLHTGKKPYQCELCKKAFADSSAFKRHRKTHKADVYVCDICDIKSKNPVSFKRHIDRCEKAISKCFICDTSFQGKNEFESHASVHSSTSFECDRCSDTSFSTYFEFNVHLLIHSRKDNNMHTSNLANKKLHGTNSSCSDTMERNLLKVHTAPSPLSKTPKSFDELFKTALIQ